VLKSDWLTTGPKVTEFESKMCAFTGANFGVAFNSATAALHAACFALGLGKGDSLWTSPNTFVASANCGLYMGATIDFVDIDERTYNMSVPALAKKLEVAERAGRLPKVVVPVHFAGQSCEMVEIKRL
jgi:dTDP-4-amino-4,6-dideoxygalactose transaminase